MVFDDRRDAGRRLAAGGLTSFAEESPFVFGLARGGVPVAAEVAAALGAPLDVLVVRKLGAPRQPELAVGAIAEDGTVVVDVDMARRAGMTQARLERTVDRETQEVRRRVERYRAGRPRLDARDRTVIVVDDGLATGLTDLAAVRFLRGCGAHRVVVAVPVGSQQAAALLRQEADEVVCLWIPEELQSVGQWYRDFSPTSDEEVLESLAMAASRSPGPASDGGTSGQA
jgi:putative phosphoribosyl transferase